MEKFGRIIACTVMVTLGAILGDVIVNGIANIDWDVIFKFSFAQAMGILAYAVFWEKN